VARGAEMGSTRSYVVDASGKDESSEAVGRMKEGDSVKESAREEAGATESKLREIRPPT
jgi:hypothetical protein